MSFGRSLCLGSVLLLALAGGASAESRTLLLSGRVDPWSEIRATWNPVAGAVSLENLGNVDEALRLEWDGESGASSIQISSLGFLNLNELIQRALSRTEARRGPVHIIIFAP